MARFDDETLAKIKSETDIVALIESYGAKLKPRGSSGELIGLCPIHDDKSPSLVVSRNKHVWNCLDACGLGGDVIEFVMAAEKASFRHAVELLSEGKVGAMEAGGNQGGQRHAVTHGRCRRDQEHRSRITSRRASRYRSSLPTITIGWAWPTFTVDASTRKPSKTRDTSTFLVLVKACSTAKRWQHRMKSLSVNSSSRRCLTGSKAFATSRHLGNQRHHRRHVASTSSK